MVVVVVVAVAVVVVVAVVVTTPGGHLRSLTGVISLAAAGRAHDETPPQRLARIKTLLRPHLEEDAVICLQPGGGSDNDEERRAAQDTNEMQNASETDKLI